MCIFPEKGAGGVCLGTFSTVDRPLPGNADQRGIWFNDGSYVYYDRSSGVLEVKAAGRVRIEGDLEVTGTLTRGGERL
ncbi:hypothetical protein YDYSY3_57950 [Paenibacillus chitinolyticus]|nr:hypothetical protein YDYSY3_57950 [Paenibacillus chitinolyticus]